MKNGLKDGGMSLVEVVVAVVVLAIVSASVLAIILQSQSAGADNRSRIAAANLAAREIDLVREQFGRSKDAPVQIANAGTVTNPHSLEGQMAGTELVVDGTPYTVTRSASWNITGDGESACEGGSLVKYPSLAISVSVTWPNMGSIKPVVSHTALAPTKGNGVPSTSSFVAVGVVDSAGAANPGRAVRVVGSNGETRSGLTDASGCAVITVNPSTSGTAYTAELTDTGYVDVNGAANPSRTVGTLTPGQLNNNVKIAYDRAASLRVSIVDEAGSPVSDADVAGSQITVISTEATGSTGSQLRTVTGAVTTIGELWPTTYGAFYGSTAPAEGYSSILLTPGDTGELDVKIALAQVTIFDAPPGTNRVLAVPAGQECSSSDAREVDPENFTLLPGAWTFFAEGAAFGCSPGPTAVTIESGQNIVTWGVTTLRVNGAPSAGTLWALNASLVGSSLSTCPAPAESGAALNVDAARSGPVEIPAGDWYVFRTAGGADADCLGIPSGQYSKVLAYESDNVLAWAEVVVPAQVTVTNAPTSPGNSYRVIASSSPIATCTTALPSGALSFSPTNEPTATRSLDQGTWYIYRQRTSGGSGNRCESAAGNPYTIGSAPSYTIDFTSSGVTTP